MSELIAMVFELVVCERYVPERRTWVHEEMLIGALDPGGELRQHELEDSRLSEKMVTTNVI